jgi:anti-anti-sigma factor
MTAMAVETGHVGCARLADGMLVQLAGEVGDEQLPALRHLLLAPVDEQCKDIVVDAGAVDEISPAALAVLVAAREWAEIQGVRFLLSRSSWAVEDALTLHGCLDGLPRLRELADAPDGAAGIAVPHQREAD